MVLDAFLQYPSSMVAHLIFLNLFMKKILNIFHQCFNKISNINTKLLWRGNGQVMYFVYLANVGLYYNNECWIVSQPLNDYSNFHKNQIHFTSTNYWQHMHFNNTLRNRLKMEDPGLGSMTFNLLRATCRRILLWVMVNSGVPGLKNSLDRSSSTASRFIPLCKHFIYLFRMEKNNNINI